MGLFTTPSELKCNNLENQPMNVNDKNMISEISKHLPRSTQNDTKQISARQLVDEKKIEGLDQAGQDAIVDFSPQLKDAQAIREIIASEPDVRKDVVATLKATIEAGRYSLDSMAVADKLVDFYIDEK